MKLLAPFLLPVPCKETRQTVVGITAVLLMMAAVSAAAILTFQFPIVIILPAVALLGFLLIRRKLYQSIFHNPLAAHMLSLFCGYTALSLLPPQDIGLDDTDVFLIPLAFLSAFLAGCIMTEIILGAVTQRFGMKQHPELFPRTFLVAVSLFFTSTLFLAADSFFANCDELSYLFIDFAPHYLLITLGGAFIVSSFLCTLRKKHLRRMTALMTGLMLGVYCQYMFMNRSLPLLGLLGEIDWSGMTGECILNAAVWAILLALPFVTDLIRKISSKKIPDLHTGTASVLGSVQLVTLITLMITKPKVFSGYDLMLLDAKEQFVISQKNNAVVFVLDMADQKQFEEAYLEQPESFAFLRDFTYYTNTAMEYDSTYHSIPAMLTHAQTQPGASRHDWYTEIFSAAPARLFYERLHDNRYSLHIYGDFVKRESGVLEGFADNLTVLPEDQFTIIKDTLYEKINTMNAFRAVPTFLKRFLHPDNELGNAAVIFQNGSKTKNADFIAADNLQLSETDNNYFIFQHVEGMHTDNSLRTALEECLTLTSQYILQMQALHVYDDALIIITADHGIHYQPDNMPIWYIKKPHESHSEMQFCNTPITLTDLPATVLDCMGLSKEGDEAILGRPISQIPEDEPRERLVFQREPFCSEEMLRAAGLPTEWQACMFFGYYYTGTKENLKQHEMNDLPDIYIENNGL